MAELVPIDYIERIVGIKRDQRRHRGRAVSAEQVVYILHSQECLDSGIDLRDCPFSVALDRGINEYDWDGLEDTTVSLRVRDGWLVPWRRR